MTGILTRTQNAKLKTLLKLCLAQTENLILPPTKCNCTNKSTSMSVELACVSQTDGVDTIKSWPSLTPPVSCLPTLLLLSYNKENRIRRITRLEQHPAIADIAARVRVVLFQEILVLSSEGCAA